MVVLTGWADVAHRKQAMEAGFDLFLVKPVDLAVIHALLKRRAGDEVEDALPSLSPVFGRAR
jgi:ActR/RegA family two-component response regulator